MLSRHFDDESDHVRRLRLPVDDQDVAGLADPVACGVEDGAPGQMATKTLVALTVKL
jgi:hypothetical protein